MTLEKNGLAVQRQQLAVLGFVHFVADMMGNFLPAIMPAVREGFALTLTMGTGVLFAFYFVHNGLQVFIGHLRTEKDKPLFLPLGLCLCGMVCFISVLSGVGFAYPLILAGAVVGASGIAMMHTEGLRALHNLGRISSSMGTAYFMAGGFLGGAFGQWAAALLVERQGFAGLYWLLALPAFALVLMFLFRIRLAVDDERDGDIARTGERYPFWQVFLMALISAVGTFMMLWFVPERLKELGFGLSFGGFSLMMFTLSSAAGSFFWGWFARRRGQLFCALVAMVLNLPILILYLVTMERSWAALLLFGVGFCGVGAYVMMVTMAREAKGLKIGQRMGLLVGGTWAVAGAAALGASTFMPAALLLGLAPICYAISVVIGLWIISSNRR